MTYSTLLLLASWLWLALRVVAFLLLAFGALRACRWLAGWGEKRRAKRKGLPLAKYSSGLDAAQLSSHPAKARRVRTYIGGKEVL